jgi:hypothetical protein
MSEVIKLIRSMPEYVKELNNSVEKQEEINLVPKEERVSRQWPDFDKDRNING